MTEMLKCAACRRIVEVPDIDEDTFASEDIARIFDIPPGSFLCFWCFCDDDGSPTGVHPQPGSIS
jgi:hypothetical protein